MIAMFINETFRDPRARVLLSISAGLRARLQEARAQAYIEAVAAAVQAFVLSRAVLLLATYLAVSLRLSLGGHPPNTASTVWDAWYQWDARWYVRVATSGYQWHDIHHYASVAFFPGYPVLIALLLYIIPMSAKLAAMLVANGAFLFALFFLYRLVRREFDADTARRTVTYLSLFPTALFFFAGYSESPFLLWTVLSVAAMRERLWGRAALWGCLAAATRSLGVLLAVPFAVECWYAYGPRLRALARAAWLPLIPLGSGLYACYLGLRYGDPLLFDQIQRAWHRTTTWPWVGVAQSLQDLRNRPLASYSAAHNLIELAFVLGFAALIVAGWRLLPRSCSLYAALSLIVTLTNPSILDGYYLPLRSTSRFCLALFPCFITMALLGRHRLFDRLVMTIAPATLMLLSAVFLEGGWVD
jgi:hypothetical protein